MLLKLVLLSAALVAASFGQTAQRLAQIKLPVVDQTSIMVVALENGRSIIKTLKLESSIVVDLVAGTIRAQQPNAAAHFVTDFFKLTAPADSFNLTKTPYPPTLATVNVYLNGAHLAEGEDYSIAAKVVTIDPLKHSPQIGDIVQIKYLEAF